MITIGINTMISFLKFHKKLQIVIIILLLLLASAPFACSQRLTVRTYEIRSAKISQPLSFVQISDLHSCFYGENQTDLLDEIQTLSPDAVLLTGDIADDKTPDDGSIALLEGLSAMDCPVYYVTGNHEFRTGDIQRIYALFAAYGVHILRGSCETLEIRGQRISLCGVDDPALEGAGGQVGGWATQLAACDKAKAPDAFSILLSHRPERTEAYAACSFDLVLAGHAHGGQWRIPGLLNGLIAPHQGLFPSYAGGEYALGDTTLVVSRGLAKSAVPRIWNPPELIAISVVPN